MSVSLVENQFLPHGVFPNLCKNKEEKWTLIVIRSSVWISHGVVRLEKCFLYTVPKNKNGAVILQIAVQNVSPKMGLGCSETGRVS